MSRKSCTDPAVRSAMVAGAASGRKVARTLPGQVEPAQPGHDAGKDSVRPASLRLEVATDEDATLDQRVDQVVLRDGAGAPCAYGGTASGRSWVRVPEVA